MLTRWERSIPVSTAFLRPDEKTKYSSLLYKAFDSYPTALRELRPVREAAAGFQDREADKEHSGSAALTLGTSPFATYPFSRSVNQLWSFTKEKVHFGQFDATEQRSHPAAGDEQGAKPERANPPRLAVVRSHGGKLTDKELSLIGSQRSSLAGCPTRSMQRGSWAAEAKLFVVGLSPWQLSVRGWWRLPLLVCDSNGDASAERRHASRKASKDVRSRQPVSQLAVSVFVCLYTVPVKLGVASSRSVGRRSLKNPDGLLRPSLASHLVRGPPN